MIKKEFNYLGKNVKLEAYNNGGLQVVNQFLQDYIFNPFEDMINGKGFYVSGKNKLILDCYNNKQVDNLLAYYQKVFS